MHAARTRVTSVAALAAVGLLMLAACTSSDGAEPAPTPTSATPAPSLPAPDPALAGFYEQQLEWRDCGEGMQCTTVRVPLDYGNPTGDSIGIAVNRRRARDPRGSLLLNPGGPGASGLEYAQYAELVLTEAVVDSYDVVGFDPRGVGASAPVDCVTDAQLDALFAADGTPDDPSEVAGIARLSAEFADGCARLSAAVAPHVDTESAVRDMDIIRAALGDEQLTFLGKSYGSLLGTTYAELFPQRVGRIVIDGVLPSSLDGEETSFGQAVAFDAALHRFARYCATKRECPLPGDPDEAVRRVQQFLVDLEAEPLPGIGDRMLGEALGTYAILSFLYFPPLDWDRLIDGLSYAFRGDGSVLMDMMDERTQRNGDGTYLDNGNEAFYAISCLDRPGLGGADHAERLAREWAEQAPVFGPYLAWGTLPCWDWPWTGPVDAEDPPVITAAGSAPILVVSTTHDTATPYEWGVQVAGELESGRLLTLDGDGHTAYQQGSACIDAAVDAYLIDGVLPGEGTVCRMDEQLPGL